MEGNFGSNRDPYVCIGSDGQPYELISTTTEDGLTFYLSDGSKVVRISKGTYKVAGKGLYLWCSQPDAP